jgi:hypothetical protein
MGVRPSKDGKASYEDSSMPFITAATADKLAALEVMLFRRVTRCVGLKVPRDTE